MADQPVRPSPRCNAERAGLEEAGEKLPVVAKPGGRRWCRSAASMRNSPNRAGAPSASRAARALPPSQAVRPS
eukprot:1529561-Pleurochrysis_carterae.AAC.1